MKELSRKVGTMEFDGLITALIPHVQVQGGTIGKTSTETTLKRGTLLGKNESGVLSVYDGTTEPDCILCDDVVVGTTDDVAVPVYTAGCFNTDKVTVAADYAITESDKDKLRGLGIVFKAASAE